MKVRAVTIALFVVAAVGPMAMAGAGGSQGDAATTVESGNDTDMGQQVSSFMQSSAGETSESVESGMWDVAVENATGDGEQEVVESRIGDIRDRLESLEQRKQVLKEARENGSIDERTYRAKMSRLVGEMAALNRSIDRADRNARAAGVNGSSVDELREMAGQVAGPELTAVAEGMAGGPAEDLPGDPGPPDEADGPTECPPDQQDDECSDEGNDSEDSPPDDEGPPDDEPPEDGPPDDDGQPGDSQGTVRDTDL